MAAEVVKEGVLLHVALLYRRPWRPTFLAMEIDKPAVIGGDGAVWVRVVSKPAEHRDELVCSFRTMWEVVGSLPLEKVIQVEWLEMKDDIADWPEDLLPALALAAPMKIEPAIMWDGPLESRRRAPVRRPAPRGPRPKRLRAAAGPAILDGDPRAPAAEEEEEEVEDDMEGLSDESEVLEDEARGNLLDMAGSDEDFSDDNVFGIPEDAAIALSAPESPPPMAPPVDGSLGDFAALPDEFSGDDDGDEADGDGGAADPDAEELLRTLPDGGSVAIPIDGQDRPGRIRIIDWADKQLHMYAVCSVREHGACMKTRTCQSGHRPGQGRPAGFLGAWLKAGAACATREEHMAVAVTLEQRKAARAELALAFRGADLLEYEAPKKDGEESEPEIFR